MHSNAEAEESANISTTRIVELEKQNLGYCGFHLTRSKWDPYPWITKVDPDSPAECAGMHPGECILEINGEDIVGKRISEVAERIKSGPNQASLLIWNCGSLPQCTPEVQKNFKAVIERAKSTTVTNQIADSYNKQKELWSIVNNVTGRAKSTTKVVHLDGCQDEQVADALNLHFVSAAGILVSKNNLPISDSARYTNTGMAMRRHAPSLSHNLTSPWMQKLKSLTYNVRGKPVLMLYFEI